MSQEQVTEESVDPSPVKVEVEEPTINVQAEEIEVAAPQSEKPQTPMVPPLTTTPSNLSRVAKTRKTTNQSRASSGFGKIA